MKQKYLINAKIIDPSQNMDILGGLIIDEKGKIKAIGKDINKSNIPSKAGHDAFLLEDELEDYGNLTSAFLN